MPYPNLPLQTLEDYIKGNMPELVDTQAKHTSLTWKKSRTRDAVQCILNYTWKLSTSCTSGHPWTHSITMTVMEAMQRKDGTLEAWWRCSQGHLFSRPISVGIGIIGAKTNTPAITIVVATWSAVLNTITIMDHTDSDRLCSLPENRSTMQLSPIDHVEACCIINRRGDTRMDAKNCIDRSASGYLQLFHIWCTIKFQAYNSMV